MELSLVRPFVHRDLSFPLASPSHYKPFTSFMKKRKLLEFSCRCSKDSSSPSVSAAPVEGRRWLLSFILAAAASGLNNSDSADAVSTSRRALRSSKIPESEFTTLPNGLKYYDIKVGGGTVAKKGSRVAVHYVAKWKGITFMTSRQGLGVVGGTPYGFDVGQSARGNVLKGLDLGVEGMSVGGQMSNMDQCKVHQAGSMKNSEIINSSS